MSDRLRSAIRDVPDFPKPGIVFKDITPILADGALFHECVQLLAAPLMGQGVTKVAGIEARGFIFAAAVAYEMGVGFIPIRKKGKLPWVTESAEYKLEYGEASVEIHKDAVGAHEKVALIDDVLATGGTAAAALKLIHKCGGQVVLTQFVIELGFLGGRKILGDNKISSLLLY